MNANKEMMDKARKLAPKMDETSLNIFASSGLIQMLYSGGGLVVPQQIHSRGAHHDCTGFFQRRKK